MGEAKKGQDMGMVVIRGEIRFAFGLIAVRVGFSGLVR